MNPVWLIRNSQFATTDYPFISWIGATVFYEILNYTTYTLCENLEWGTSFLQGKMCTYFRQLMYLIYRWLTIDIIVFKYTFFYSYWIRSELRIMNHWETWLRKNNLLYNLTTATKFKCKQNLILQRYKNQNSKI